MRVLAKASTSMSVVLLFVALGAVPAEAQFSLKKVKKAVDKATDIKQEVDRFTFSEAEEVELGRAISRRILSRYGVERDYDATRYLSLVGAAIASKSGRAGLPWAWIILDSDAVNAFAAPGGWVHITRGALAVITSEAELAGVLAHEAAHVVEKHTLKGLQKSMGTELAGDQADFSVGSDLFEVVADKAAAAVLAGFGRAEELEADEVGVEIAARVGYSAEGLSTFLTSLDEMQTDSRTASVLYRSHPETRERLERLEKQRLEQVPRSDIWLAERYDREIPYDIVASTGTGPGAVDGARGVAGGEESGTAGSEEQSAADSDTDKAGEEAEGKKSFSLAKIVNPFQMGEQEESAEVTGAGAGRGVGEETEGTESGPKSLEPFDMEITEVELRAFLREGGLE